MLIYIFKNLCNIMSIISDGIYLFFPCNRYLLLRYFSKLFLNVNRQRKHLNSSAFYKKYVVSCTYYFRFTTNPKMSCNYTDYLKKNKNRIMCMFQNILCMFFIFFRPGLYVGKSQSTVYRNCTLEIRMKFIV